MYFNFKSVICRDCGVFIVLKRTDLALLCKLMEALFSLQRDYLT